MRKKEIKTTSKSNNKKNVISKKCNTDALCPVWIFTNIDKSGEYAFDLDRKDFQHKEFIDKMIHYSNMTWDEIKKQTHDNNKSKHHYIPYNILSKTAQNRLKIKNLSNKSEQIFSFAFNNKLRIVGVREHQYFFVLWYDSKHEVCPSTLRHS